ncbi:hypothetical protein KCP74_08210 [Salmonella enterica subsp. enterica]|nr:hypothetical protein KCP74_08210 [Salmonella enterica subsp. enterica]
MRSTNEGHISTLSDARFLLAWGDPPPSALRRFTLSSAWGRVGPALLPPGKFCCRNESFTPMLRWLHS